MSFMGRLACLMLIFLAIVMSSLWFLTQNQSVQAQGRVSSFHTFLSLQSVTLPSSLTQAGAKIVDEDFIRVGLSDQSMQNQEYYSAQISATGTFQALDAASGKEVFRFADNASPVIPVISVSVDTTGFTIRNGINVLASQLKGPILVKPLSASSRVNLPNIQRYKRVPNYRGYFEITRAVSSPKKLSVVNILPLQDYLRAVVPNELPAKYGTEAIRAQAVAARNYVLRPRDKVWPQFDICDSQYCQAYYGAQTETPSTSKALEETEGLVALYDGEIALALYSSASGGYREAYKNAFSDPITKQYPAPDIPYLSAGPDVPLDKTLFPTAKDLSSEAAAKQFWTRSDIDSYDVNSPNYRWTRNYTRFELEHLLEQNLRDASKDKLTANFIEPKLLGPGSIGTLKAIKVTKRAPSGKAMFLEIQGTHGTWTVKKEFVIRKVFKQNSRMLQSANMIITPVKDMNGVLTAFKIQGGGLGHGVGMSQLGASWMHFHGFKFINIIQHYYPGVSLGTIPLTVGAEETLSAPSSGSIVNRNHSGGGHTGVQHQFFVRQADQAHLVLRVEAGVETVYVALNGKPYAIHISKLPPVGDSAASHLVEYRVRVGQLLAENELNRFVLFPDSKVPSHWIRAWVELYPSETTAMHAPVSTNSARL